MTDQDLTTLPDTIVAGASSRVEACRDELHGLLTDAQKDYRGIITELDLIVSVSSDRKDEALSTRVENLHRSKQLQQSASEYDSAINRLSEAISFLGDATDALQGKAVRQIPSPEDRTSLEIVAMQAQEEERYRLAREIHDGPAQILANVALQLEYISKLALRDPAKAKDEMETIQKDLRLAVGEVRRFMYDLRPPALAQQGGLGAAVESHCQRLAHRFGMEITIDWKATAPLPPSHDTAVFRIIQEALQNVVKHAQATKADIQAVDAEDHLEVTVSDNGRGFEPDHVRRLDPKHFGLAGMRARAQQIGASLEVSSVPNRGTTVCLRVPFA